MAANIIPLGARLRERREQLGLSQAQAARELEVARTAYRLWEMEAARPAPDRWRTIANWLGVSVSALLLAAELIDEQEADEAQRATIEAGLADVDWDEQGNVADGDFFTQERSTIDRHARAGTLSAEQATSLRDLVGRIQSAALDDGAHWHPGRFSKRFPSTPLTPSLARAALTTTAVGIPIDDFNDAALLVSELVTNAVQHSDSEWIDVDITLDAERLRIEVSDQSPQPPRPRISAIDGEGGFGFALVAQLAQRWGVERHTTGKTIWIEFDLTP
jgi:transcriptional regulator with XRE-family HTH domain/anti-sigma regulatory factor (Ser/Thr protein kinase)